MGNQKTRKPGVSNQIETYTLFSSEAIVASASSTSAAVNLHNRTGVFSIQYTFTGTGTLKFEYLVSHSGVAGSFVEPSEAVDIASGLSAGSDVVSFKPVLAPFIQIKATETGGANPVSITSLTLAVQ